MKIKWRDQGQICWRSMWKDYWERECSHVWIWWNYNDDM